jgi:hypothetical protein
VSWVTSKLQSAGACYSFRVRGASGKTWSLRFRCQDPQHVWKTLDMSLAVEAASPHRISALTNIAVTSDPY